MYCRQSRKARMSYGRCSISNTTPSYGAVFMRLRHPDFRGAETDEGGLVLLQRGNHAIEARCVGHCVPPRKRQSAYVHRLPASIRESPVPSQPDSCRTFRPIFIDRFGFRNQGFDRGEMILPGRRLPARQADRAGRRAASMSAAHNRRRRCANPAPSSGSRYSGHLPPFSRNAARLLHRTGTPSASASTSGNPNPSAKEGSSSACAPLTRRAASASGTLVALEDDAAQ